MHNYLTISNHTPHFQTINCQNILKITILNIQYSEFSHLFIKLSENSLKNPKLSDNLENKWLYSEYCAAARIRPPRAAFSLHRGEALILHRVTTVKWHRGDPIKAL